MRIALLCLALLFPASAAASDWHRVPLRPGVKARYHTAVGAEQVWVKLVVNGKRIYPGFTPASAALAQQRGVRAVLYTQPHHLFIDYHIRQTYNAVLFWRAGEE